MVESPLSPKTRSPDAARREPACCEQNRNDATVAKGESGKRFGRLGRLQAAARAPHGGAGVDRIEQSGGVGSPNRLQSKGFAVSVSASTTRELALWRAFLGDEIDAVLRDKD
jgi:hypothetical protein